MLWSPMVNEQPLYAVYQSRSRALIPKALLLLGLSLIFYAGVLLNVALLELNAQQETTLKTSALVILIVVIIVGVILTYKKTQQPYLFYKNRIMKGKDGIYYLNILNTTPQSNFFDQKFKTYSIQLGKKFALRHVPASVQLTEYIQQLVEYSRKNQASEN